MITLGIETSCDETSFAVLENGRKVRSNIVHSSLLEHKKYGGVVPEIASRSHVEILLKALEQSLRKAKICLKDIDLVAVTQGPGLMGSLLVGVSAGKALAYSLNKPLIGVDHVMAHLYAGFLTDPKLKFPFLGLAVSGGHTALMRIESPRRAVLLGRTLDDAAGEAFDKVAKTLGLGYPGGPEIDRLSQNEDPGPFFFSRPFLSSESLDFSFSGIKTAVYTQVERIKKTQSLSLKIKKQICTAFQDSVCDVLTQKTFRAMKQQGLSQCVVGGGVSANTRLRHGMRFEARKAGARVVFPPLEYCQDNAAMIAILGAAQYKAGKRDKLTLPAYANFSDNPCLRTQSR